MATPQELLSALGRAYALTEAPFETDQEYLEALQAVVDAHDSVGWLIVRIDDAGFRVKDQVLQDLPEAASLFGTHLRKAGIAELRFQETLQTEIVREFLRQVHPSAEVGGVPPSSRFRGFEEFLGLSFSPTEGCRRGMAGGIQELFREWEAPTPASDALAGGAEAEPEVAAFEPEYLVPADFPEFVGPPGSVGFGESDAEPAPEADDPEPVDGVDEPESSATTDLGDASALADPSDLSGFADLAEIVGSSGTGDQLEPEDRNGPEDRADTSALADAPEAPEPGESMPAAAVADEADEDGVLDAGDDEAALRERVKVLSAQRDFQGLARLLEELVDPSNETFSADTAQRLAEEFTTPAVASSIVARLATSRDEGERARLGTVVARIGREGPPAVADALEQARNRSERRALVEAMVALGPRGFDLAQRMVEDSRWYVVRNGVSVMGEVGGDEAVTHLTATLASEDARVRRETVLALAKLGGHDADTLILGMLNDPEPPVRAVACRACGVLGLERAIRPLVGLMADPDQEVQVEAIQALGLIGDPGPVQQIEKKALGGFLAKPAAPIRIAAFRSLAAIGTPRALKTLQKGASDPNEDVRASVRKLLRT